ncbi:MAG: T9SS type A sorting domain-containing protein, partial [Bacteroidia bacterium]
SGSTYYYYAEITQADGDVIWTSPIWYTRNSNSANAPITSFTFSGSSFCVGQPVSLTDLSTNTPTGWQWTLIGASVNTSSLQNPSVTYTAAGIYSISLIATNTVGTGVPLTKTISIGGTAPSLTVSGSASVCAGNSVAITATGATNYTWSTGANTSSIAVSPTSSAVYTVTGSNGGCTSSLTKSITVGALPFITVSGLNPICGGGSSTLTAAGASTYSWSTGSTAASVIVSPTVNTTYTVSGTSANGCKNKTVTTVSVGPSPTISIAGQNTLCAGSSSTLTSSGAISYTWNTGSNATSITITPTANATYTVTGANTSGCKSSKTVTVTVNTLPAITIAGSNTACAGSTLMLTGSGATSFTWSTGANTSTVSVFPTSNTTYTLTGTNSNGCKNTITKTVTVSTSVIIASGGAICPGNSFTINPSGAATYTYSGGSQVVSPSSTTSYTVNGTTSQGCSAQFAVLTVTVAPTLTVNITGTNSVCYGNSIILTANGAASYTWNTGATTNTISVTPLAGTTYSVFGSGGMGCSGTSVKSVSVVALPVVTASGSNSVICIGQTSTLTAAGAASYTWSNSFTTPAITVSPTITTTYSVTGSNSNGCTGSAVKTVTVIALPVVSALASNSIICAGQTSTLTASGATSYTWSNSFTTPSIVISPTITTTYTVTGSNGSGCKANASITQSVSACTSIDVINMNTPVIKLFPNPTSGNFTIYCEQSAGVALYNLTGQLIFEKKTDSGYSSFSIEKESAGLYFIRISTQGKTATLRLVKD